MIFTALISSYSMYPAIKPKDRILIVRIFNGRNIKRGDILVFFSKEYQELMIKRVIGLPNDFVEINDDGLVYINHTKLDEPYVAYPGGPSRKFKVPERKHLLLGDNRAQSTDSRSWAEPYISEQDIRGRAVLRYFPLNRLGRIICR